mmetsp:Transcript_13002/g.29513  ORF Transcript_13002/g.29513 Transcript_13002/m.29513 type:complete len:233 (+) Transcript_13002:580-1278(+)
MTMPIRISTTTAAVASSRGLLRVLMVHLHVLLLLKQTRLATRHPNLRPAVRKKRKKRWRMRHRVRHCHLLRRRRWQPCGKLPLVGLLAQHPEVAKVAAREVLHGMPCLQQPWIDSEVLEKSLWIHALLRSPVPAVLHQSRDGSGMSHKALLAARRVLRTKNRQPHRHLVRLHPMLTHPERATGVPLSRHPVHDRAVLAKSLRISRSLQRAVHPEALPLRGTAWRCQRPLPWT